MPGFISQLHLPGRGGIQRRGSGYLEFLCQLATEAVKHGQVEGTKVCIEAAREETVGGWRLGPGRNFRTSLGIMIATAQKRTTHVTIN